MTTVWKPEYCSEYPLSTQAVRPRDERGPPAASARAHGVCTGVQALEAITTTRLAGGHSARPHCAPDFQLAVGLQFTRPRPSSTKRPRVSLFLRRVAAGRRSTSCARRATAHSFRRPASPRRSRTSSTRRSATSWVHRPAARTSSLHQHQQPAPAPAPAHQHLNQRRAPAPLPRTCVPCARVSCARRVMRTVWHAHGVSCPRVLAGKQGSIIRALQERLDVKIAIPPTEKAPSLPHDLPPSLVISLPPCPSPFLY